MATKLIEHLKKKSQEHGQLKALVTQWELDEALIPKALQNIGVIFPHYSRHDASHSLQILVNIERLLGDDIAKLSATDTWLILEAAYWHDIGMIVPADIINRDLGTQEFKRFITEIADTTGHELRDLAKNFDCQNASACFSGISSPLDAMEKLRLLLAEYYRRQHPKRSEAIVQDPWNQVSLSSPRNELLPKRFFSMLGRICHLHGKDFSYVLKELEFRQVGMGGENCHPRFVACLLRLGDLLDLEDNRFCPVMLRMVKHIPSSSYRHIDKHNSIRHFRLDRNRIEITACCNNAAAYEETEFWFSWLRQEIQNQMANWRDIVPKRTFGLLPTLGDLQVILDGDEQWLDSDSKERPRFDIDPEKAIELLQGAGLYKKPEQSLRELLQNAVDATLQRVWLEHSPDAGNTPLYGDLKLNWNNPNDPEMLKLLKRYTIEVKFSPLVDHSENDKRYWELSIRDYGIGISRNDLRQIRHVGNAGRNLDKEQRIKTMPYWMRPSGSFGIGLQSAFMLTDEIYFQTKSYLTGETQDITLYSPLSHQQGLITIKKCDQLFSKASCGSILTLRHKFEKIPNNFSVRLGYQSKPYEALCHFDPIINSELEIEQMNWLEEIEKFAENSPIPIHLKFKSEPDTIKQVPKKFTGFFDSETNIALEISPCPEMAHMGRKHIYFRGQAVSSYHESTPFLVIYYNLWGYNATNLLSVNRNDVRESSISELDEKQKRVLINYLNENPPEQFSADMAQSLSAHIQIHKNLSYDDYWKGLLKQWKDNDQWKNLTLVEDNNKLGKTFNDLYKIPSFCICRKHPPSTSQKIEIADPGNLMFFSGPHNDDIGLQFLAHELQKSGFYLQITEKDNNFTKLGFTKASQPHPYSDSALKAALNQLTKSGSHYTRVLMPIYPAYRRLKLKDTTVLKFVRSFPGAKYLRHPCIVMPFCFHTDSYKNRQIIEDNLDDLCNWTIKHAEDASLTLEEVRALYQKLIKWIDRTIMQEDNEWKKLRGFNQAHKVTKKVPKVKVT